MNNDRIQTNSTAVAIPRGGVATLELIVASVVLMVAMTFVTSMCYRINRVWKDVTQQRIAMNELANHLEVLTLMSESEIDSALASLKASKLGQQSLNTPVLTGEKVIDDLGIRIDLQLTWKRIPARQPLVLSGWLIDKPGGQNE